MVIEADDVHKGEEHMYKIVVVDDEARQCRGLKNILLRLFTDIEVEAFTSAETAFHYIEKNQVRIIITDICMPEMDGLAFTQKIREKDGSTKVILLTGFAEFEYARKAITCGAFDYLLKPTNPDKLQEVLERALDDLKQEEILEQQHENIQKKLDMTLPVYVERLLNQWVYGWTSEEEIKEVKKIIPWGKDGFVMATKLTGLRKWKKDLESDAFMEVKSQFGLRIREEFGRGWHCLSFFSNVLQDTMITLAACDAPWNGYPACLKEKDFFRQIPGTDSEGKYILCPVFGIGSWQSKLAENIEKGYKSAVEVLPYSFYFPGAKIIRSDYILSHKIQHMNISLAEEELVKDAIKEGDGEKATDILEAVLERCMNAGYPDPKQVMNNCENILRHTALELKFDRVFHIERTEEEQVDFDMLRCQIRVYLNLLADYKKQKREGKNLEFAGKFTEYLEQHFMEEISLEDVAEYFHLTPSYCSALIKDSTGNSFSKSLISMRIGRAKKLLKESDMKIYQVALDTGYRDVKYFNRVFKKETGITPIQYREGIREIEEDVYAQAEGLLRELESAE